jgi:hypothetical protein
MLLRVSVPPWANATEVGSPGVCRPDEMPSVESGLAEVRMLRFSNCSPISYVKTALRGANHAEHVEAANAVHNAGRNCEGSMRWGQNFIDPNNKRTIGFVVY